MRTNLPTFSLAISLGAALALTSIASADEPQPKARHRHAKVANREKLTRADSRKSGQNADGTIPTRDGRHSKEVEGGLAGGAIGPEHRVLTGSHVPQRYNRRGYTTDSDQNVFIIDQHDQALQRADTPSEALRTVPGLRVSGPHGL